MEERAVKKTTFDFTLQLSAVSLLLLILLTATLLFLFVIPVSSSEIDEQIESSIKKSYVFKTYAHGNDIGVQCKDGIVTLRGEATSMAQKDLATEYAQEVAGVKVVENEMTIVSAAAMKPGKRMVGLQIEPMP